MAPRVTILVPSLSHGGAERVAAQLANLLAARPYQVTVVTLDAGDEDTYPVDAAVKRIPLDEMRTSGSKLDAIKNNWTRLRRLRQEIHSSQPDVVISFTDKMNILAMLAGRGLKLPIVLAERSNPARQNLGPFWERLRRWAYPKCRFLIVQSTGVMEFLSSYVLRDKIRVIPNSVGSIGENPQPNRSPTVESGRIVSVMRYSHEKGGDLLIQAFAKLADQYPGWNLEIFGEGPLRESWQALAQRLNISDRVQLAGWQDDLNSIMAKADLFVLPSRYEGFPNALLEAMSVGLPAISFDCDFGPRDIIRHNIDGILVPPESVTELSQAVRNLIDDPKERQQMGTRAREVAGRFSENTFIDAWEAVIADATSSGGS